MGAVLGGGAQLLAAHLQEARRHQQWLREQRAAIYKGFAADAQRRLDALVEAHNEGGPDAPDDFVVAVFDAAEDVSLFGSDAARRLANTTAQSLLSVLGAATAQAPDAIKGAERAIAAFRSQARADLIGRNGPTSSASISFRAGTAQ